jgi:hypothetical protein
LLEVTSSDILVRAIEVLAQMRRSKLFAAFGLFAAVMCAADNPFIGAWKLNNAKSKFSPGTEMGTNYIMTFEQVGDQVKRTDKGTSPDGKPIDISMSTRWDGVDHDQGTSGLTVAVKRINTRTVEVTLKHEGTVVVAHHASISPDGNTMTVTSKGVDRGGHKVDNTAIFEKQ